MNPNCGLFYPSYTMSSADYILKNNMMMNHEQFIDHIIKCALERHHKKGNPTKVIRNYDIGGFHTVANRFIKK